MHGRLLAALPHGAQSFKQKEHILVIRLYLPGLTCQPLLQDSGLFNHLDATSTQGLGQVL